MMFRISISINKKSILIFQSLIFKPGRA